MQNGLLPRVRLRGRTRNEYAQNDTMYDNKGRRRPLECGVENLVIMHTGLQKNLIFVLRNNLNPFCMYKLLRNLVALTVIAAICSCTTGAKNEISLPYESYTLDNGLKVVLHQDSSDPIVALAIQYHVGSGREQPGKTGFAHFFEHMLFQRSENLPRNAFFTNIAAMGGSFNGSTNTDGTNYYEVVPRDALEKVLWMESDRMGFFINTVTQGGLEREIDIVSNEKRQNYDTQPYGQSSVIVAQELYPKGHPYSWTTIGEIDDLRGATIEDVKKFYGTYYVPGNATMVLAGDFDIAQAKELIQKYFGEIDKGIVPPRPVAQPVKLAETKKMMWEDDFARLPQLALYYPGVEQYHPDSYALSYFTSLFASGKKSPLYKVIVEEKKLAPNASAGSMSREVAGQISVSVRAFNNIALNEVYSAIDEAFARFEAEGVDQDELDRLKVMQEVGAYSRLGGIQGKALMMARDNEFGGTPTRSLDEIAKYQAVTKEQIMAVYNKYIKGKTHLALSMVPKGKTQLALSGSVPAVVSTEKADEIQSKSQEGVIIDDPYERTASAFDRSVEPGYLPNTPEIKTPEIWNYQTANGMKVYGISHNELPLIQASINIPGGALLDPQGKRGVSYLNARLMTEGTALKTAEELEFAIGKLGARISVSSSLESTEISVSALAKNFDQVMALVEEVILQPRFDASALERIKSQTKTTIISQNTNPSAVAGSTRDKLIYGEDHVLAQAVYGTAESLDAITVEDIKAYYNAYISPSVAAFHIVGAIDKATSETRIASLVGKWQAKDVNIPVPAPGVSAKGKTIYLVDNPGVTQSVIHVSKQAMPMNHPDYYPSLIANYRLGSGSQGLLFEYLRLQRGYTYGASSSIRTGKYYTHFTGLSSVQGTKTKESVELFVDLIGNYAKRFDETMLETTKNSMGRAMASAFETPSALVNMLGNISYYNLPFDYVKQSERTLKNITVDQVKDVIKKNLNLDDMVIVVVGDAKLQRKPLESLGMKVVPQK
jgi:Predicted Zn-dependent peptidases